MPSLEPVLKHVNSFKVTGFATRTQNADEFNEKTAKLSHLWQTFYSSELAAHSPIYGVYSDYASDANGFYTVTAGVHSDNITKELSSVDIQAGNYLVFQGKGPMPMTVVETWQRIWDYFALENSPERTFLTDFELYKNGDEIEIYIGVK